MLRLSLDALQILDAIDRRGSFSAAGTELHRVPSTISYTVSKLEDDLGVRVFERNGPKVSLTPAGAELLKEGRYLLKAAEDLEHRVQQLQVGDRQGLAPGTNRNSCSSTPGSRMRVSHQLRAAPFSPERQARKTSSSLRGSSTCFCSNMPDARAARAQGSGKKPNPSPASWNWYLLRTSGMVKASCPNSKPTVRGGMVRAESATTMAR